MDAWRWSTSMKDEPPAGVTLCYMCRGTAQVRMGIAKIACGRCHGRGFSVDWEQVEKELEGER